jgi:hypothetical protein
MRHATSWRKNQSGDDAFGRQLETSNTTITVDTVLPFFYFSTRTTYTIRIKFQTKFHHRRAIEHIIISQKYYYSHHRHRDYYLLFTYIFINTFFVMHQLSNDTGVWNLIIAPLSSSSSLLYNANIYDTIPNIPAIINNPILPILSLTSTQAVTIERSSVNYWAFTLILFPLFTIFGNVLVVISVYREKSLHTITNYFVVSLAISDIAVAAVVMPFAIYLEVSRQKNIKQLTIDHQSMQRPFFLSLQDGNEHHDHVVTVTNIN